MPAEKIKVLYLAGVARSGSTLLGRLMGEPEEAVHVGEMVYIWQRSFREQHICGCGAPFLECPFWIEVFERGFGGFDGVDYEEILATKLQLERVRAWTHSLFPGKSPALRRRSDQYRQTLGILYRAIAETAGARLVIDSSKSEAYASFLATVPTLEMSVLHLVRDSRAVAFSHRRPKPDPTRENASKTMATVPPFRMALLWTATNLLLNRQKSPPRRAFLRYEDFVATPEDALRRLWALAGEPFPAHDILQTSPMQLRVNHTVSGNPDRFNSQVTIRPDEEWRQKMPARDRFLVTALTFPLLLHYGYLPPQSFAKEKQPIQPTRVL